jgi:hypothetical protein
MKIAETQNPIRQFFASDEIHPRHAQTRADAAGIP